VDLMDFVSFVKGKPCLFLSNNGLFLPCWVFSGANDHVQNVLFKYIARTCKACSSNVLRDRAKRVLLLTDCLSFAIVCNNDFNVPYDNLIDRHFIFHLF